MATARLVAQGRRLEVLIGGKGPQADELKSRSHALGLDDVVRFLGFVPDETVGQLYREADVVVCPSISLLESTPITLQEAMAFGTPVVGTTLPGTEETVPNDGIRGRLVEPKDVVALASAIGQLLDAGRPPPNGGARTWNDTAKDYLELFDTLERRGAAG